jgi:hypothetical protein
MEDCSEIRHGACDGGGMGAKRPRGPTSSVPGVQRPCWVGGPPKRPVSGWTPPARSACSSRLGGAAEEVGAERACQRLARQRWGRRRSAGEALRAWRRRRSGLAPSVGSCSAHSAETDIGGGGATGSPRAFASGGPRWSPGPRRRRQSCGMPRSAGRRRSAEEALELWEVLRTRA